ncbi:MAG: tetratricopeptide repeat protein [Lachnospiraceae bacterium]|nr:tetratricopeptide repeat protein [Lachnospiraceae bacterium]
MAQIRNFTAAIPVLEKSLELNKHNSDARNLLGLIYYETGDIVNALSCWLVSRHLDPEDNEADYFLEKIKKDTQELDSMNQAVKKYNLALGEARQHNFDLAIIQLKRALTINRKMLKAYQLLALIYIENGENVKAYKLINAGLKIDVGNTALLKYRAELTGSTVEGEGEEEITDTSDAGDKPIAAKFSYKEDKPSILPFVNLILGVILGIICSQWLIVPTVKKNAKQEYESSKIDYSAELAAKSATIQQLQETITNQEKEISKLEGMLGGDSNSVSVNVNSESYTNFFEAWSIYRDLTAREYTDDELIALAYKLWKIDEKEIAQEYASNILKSMRSEIYPLASKKVYEAGKNLYENEMYDEAVMWLNAACDMDTTYDNPYYYLGKSYQAMGKYEEAIESYNKVTEVVPNSTLKDMVAEKISECRAAIS